MRTNHVRTRRFAASFHANFTRWARNFFARRIDAKPGARTNEVGRTNEFAVAAFLDARSFVTHKAHGTEITFVRRTIAIVIEAIAGFHLRSHRPHAHDSIDGTLRNARAANARLSCVADFASTSARETFEEIDVIVVVTVVVEGIRSRSDVTIFECQVKRIGRDLGDIRNGGDPSTWWIAARANGIPLLFGIMNLESRTNDGKTNEAPGISGIGFDIGASNYATDRSARRNDNVDLRGSGRRNRIGIDVVPTNAKITGGFVQEKRRFEVAKRRKDRRLGARVGLKVNGFTPLLKQRVKLDFTVR